MTLHVSSTDIELLNTCASQTTLTVCCYHKHNRCVMHNCALN